MYVISLHIFSEELVDESLEILKSNAQWYILTLRI